MGRDDLEGGFPTADSRLGSVRVGATVFARRLDCGAKIRRRSSDVTVVAKGRQFAMNPCPICRSLEWEHFCAVPDRLRKIVDQSWEILRCRSCGLGRTEPAPGEKDLMAYYPPGYWGDVVKTLERFQSGQLVSARSWRQEAEKVRLLERYLREGSLLDVGCGDGKFLWGLDAGRWQRTGLEPSRRVVRLVRERIPDIDFVIGDLYSSRLQPGSFDAITFWHVLEHLPDPRRVLRRVRDLLRPKGWLIVSLPNLSSLQARIFRRHWYAFDDVPRHLFHYSPRSLALLLDQEDFEVRDQLGFSRIIGFHCLKHSLVNWSESLFGSRAPYYSLKPILPLCALLERVAGRTGIITLVARKRTRPRSEVDVKQGPERFVL